MVGCRWDCIGHGEGGVIALFSKCLSLALALALALARVLRLPWMRVMAVAATAVL